MIEKNLNTCSIQTCGNDLSDRPLLPVMGIEEEYGLMCIDCLQHYYNAQSSLVLCKVCDRPVEIVHFPDPKFDKKEFFCEKCARCGGDELQERTLYFNNSLQDLKRKFHKWQKKRKKIKSYWLMKKKKSNK